MTRLSIPAKHRPALAAFIDRCLDPLPPETLVDTAYNSLERRARGEAWRAGRLRAAYERTRLDCFGAESTWAAFVLGDDARDKRALADREKVLPAWRDAVAALALTPAPDKAAVAWKRTVDMKYLSITAEQLAESIAKDEAFLAAHPTRMTRKMRG